VLGLWSADLPRSLSGDATFVVTTTETLGAFFTLRVTHVGDDPGCEDEPSPDPGESCLDVICGPSGYYQLVGQLPDYLRDLLE
jgi:hypothetical protein